VLSRGTASGDASAKLTRGRRSDGLTSARLLRSSGSKRAHVAFIEVARRKPSLKLMARIGKTLGPDPRELLVLAHPEARVLLSPTESESDPRERLPPSWQRFIENSALLARYQVTKRELQILEHLSLLGNSDFGQALPRHPNAHSGYPRTRIVSPRKPPLASSPHLFYRSPASNFISYLVPQKLPSARWRSCRAEGQEHVGNGPTRELNQPLALPNAGRCSALIALV
jgi:hypothetical protein